MRSDQVVAIDTSGAQVAEQTLPRAHGRFRPRVHLGQYAVELLADGNRVHDRLLQTHGATARTGRATTVMFSFGVPYHFEGRRSTRSPKLRTKLTRRGSSLPSPSAFRIGQGQQADRALVQRQGHGLRSLRPPQREAPA